jgi:hypothetical protein
VDGGPTQRVWVKPPYRVRRGPGWQLLDLVVDAATLPHEAAKSTIRVAGVRVSLGLTSPIPRVGLSRCLIIRTIRRAPSGPDGIDEAPDLSSVDPSGADQIDAEHQATDLEKLGATTHRARQLRQVPSDSPSSAMGWSRADALFATVRPPRSGPSVSIG